MNVQNDKRGRVRWFFSYGLPLYAIVLVLLFIAVQPLLVPTIQESRGYSPAIDEVVEPSDTRSIAAIARMSLDATKERVDGMKESYDRLFAVIATLGAVLVFLGFKGFESFMQARDNAFAIVEKSKAAVVEANEAKAQAEAALKELHTFLHVDYPRDNSAEINVAHGLVLREMAVVYRCIAQHMGKDVTEFPEYREVLFRSLMYLQKVRTQAGTLDSKVMTRALVTMGNVESMLGNLRGALDVCEEVIDKHAPEDEAAHFNAACYACRLGAEEMARGAHGMAKTYADLAIVRLAKAIQLLPTNLHDAQTDEDFKWLREEQPNPAFLNLVSEERYLTQNNQAVQP